MRVSACIYIDLSFYQQVTDCFLLEVVGEQGPLVESHPGWSRGALTFRPHEADLTMLIDWTVKKFAKVTASVKIVTEGPIKLSHSREHTRSR